MDHDIVRLLKKKDQKAIVLLEERYEKLIRYIAGTILMDRDDAIDECLNDVYMKIWLHGAGYDYKKASFKTYIKVITRNTALNALRKVKVQEEYEDSDQYETIQDEYVDYHMGPEDKAVQKEEVQILEEILKGMKNKDRELVLRRFYYLQSSKQIALAMKMTENAVDSKLSRLRKKIRIQYEKEAIQ